MCSIVEAVNHDIKQRLFTHQDKLKDIQTILLQKDLTINEVLNFLY